MATLNARKNVMAMLTGYSRYEERHRDRGNVSAWKYGRLIGADAYGEGDVTCKARCEARRDRCDYHMSRYCCTVG